MEWLEFYEYALYELLYLVYALDISVSLDDYYELEYDLALSYEYERFDYIGLVDEKRRVEV